MEKAEAQKILKVFGFTCDASNWKGELEILIDEIRTSFPGMTGYGLTEEQAEKVVKKYSSKVHKLSAELRNLSRAIDNVK